MARSRRLHALGAEQVLHSNGNTRQGLDHPLAPIAIRLFGGGDGMIGRFDDERIERLCPGNGRVEGIGHFARGKIAGAKAIANTCNA